MTVSTAYVLSWRSRLTKVHVEAHGGGIDDLTKCDMAVTGQIPIVGQEVQTRAGATRIGGLWSLKHVSWLRTKVIRINR